MLNSCWLLMFSLLLTQISNLCVSQTPYSTFSCVHPPPPPTHTHLNTNTQCSPQLPCAAGSLISIQLKHQESTRASKRYPDKQNSKYLHPQGLHCTLPPISCFVFCVFLLSFIFSPLLQLLALFFHLALPRLSGLSDLPFQKADTRGWAKGAGQQPAQKLHSGFYCSASPRKSQQAAKRSKSLFLFVYSLSP